MSISLTEDILTGLKSWSKAGLHILKIFFHPTKFQELLIENDCDILKIVNTFNKEIVIIPNLKNENGYEFWCFIDKHKGKKKSRRSKTKKKVRNVKITTNSNPKNSIKKPPN